MSRVRGNASLIGDEIRSARQVSQLSQRDLAEQAGISRSALAQYESGRSQPPAGVLDNIARVLGRPMSSFVTSTPPEAPQDAIESGFTPVIVLRVLPWQAGNFTLTRYTGPKSTEAVDICECPSIFWAKTIGEALSEKMGCRFENQVGRG
jgi:transcriptional regulator with XRE-family HTH domain